MAFLDKHPLFSAAIDAAVSASKDERARKIASGVMSVASSMNANAQPQASQPTPQQPSSSSQPHIITTRNAAITNYGRFELSPIHSHLVQHRDEIASRLDRDNRHNWESSIREAIVIPNAKGRPTWFLRVGSFLTNGWGVKLERGNEAQYYVFMPHDAFSGCLVVDDIIAKLEAQMRVRS